MKKRYVAVIDFYINADNDNQALKEAEKIARALDVKFDNKASVIELYEQPFGTMSNRKIK